MSEKKRLDVHSGNLSDRQSTRTTFRFSKEALEALGWLSEQYRVKMKDVLHYALEQLIEHKLREGETAKASESTDGQQETGELLTNLAIGVVLSRSGNDKAIKEAAEKTVRRTVVVTKKTLTILNKFSKENNLSRDDLINDAIIYTKLWADKHNEIKIASYKEASKIINKLSEEAENAESNLLNLMGEDDPFVGEIMIAVAIIKNTQETISDEVNKRIRQRS